MPPARRPASRPASAVEPLRPNPHTYEINTWPWLDRLSSAAGKPVRLGSVPEAEWDRIATWGMDVVYLMGIWQRSPAGRRIAKQQPDLLPVYDQALPGWKLADVIGSPFSVAAYLPDPRIGSWKDVDAAREQLRKRGMRLVVDFVPNHTALDHPWIEQHPEYYVQGSEVDLRRDPGAFHIVEDGKGGTRVIAQGRDPFFLPWHDTAQLNYFRPELRAEMIAVLRTIAEHADGVRCDMAMLVLNAVFRRTWEALLDQQPAPATEFWHDAITAVPELLWIAEVYWDLETELQNLGFQFTYDKHFHERLPHASPTELRAFLRDAAMQAKMVRFLENHDEPRAATAFPGEKLFAASIAQSLLPGMRFYYDGQFEGRHIRPPLQLARVAEEPPNQIIEDFYRRLLALAGSEAFHRGTWQMLDVQAERDDDPSSQNLLAWQWKMPRDLRIVVVNLGASVAQGRVICRDAGSGDVTLNDDLNATAYLRNGAEMADPGLYVRLQGYGAHVFSSSASATASSTTAGK